MPIIVVFVEFIIPILSKSFPPITPSLDTSQSNIRTFLTYYDAEIQGDTNTEHYLAFQTGDIGYTSIKLTNNDESILTVNNIYLQLIDYKYITDIIVSDGTWGGGYSYPIYYGVQLDNFCKKYRCILLDKESAEKFSTTYELPDETNIKIMGEQIECNNTDEIEIFFSTMHSGLYRFKIVIDYSIRSFNDTIESEESVFISLDSNY